MHWFYLVLAVILEVIGTTAMKWLVNHGYIIAGTVFVALMVGLAYVALSQATNKIPIALANAFWEGLGMILIASISFLLLGEVISFWQFMALLLAVIGIAVINIGNAMQGES